MPAVCVMIPSKVTAHPACRERRVKHSGKNNHLVKTAIRCRSLHRHEIKVKLCQKPLSKQDQCVCVCVCVCKRVISLQTALGSFETFSSLKPSRGNRFTFCLIKHTHRHAHNHMQTHRPSREHRKRKKTSHLAPRQRHFCEKLEWHQLHSDKNGFGPGCWLSNTFWCRSTGTFIRSQIRCLTFTPKHISHTGRRQTELMHRITPCSLPHPFHFPLLEVPHYIWEVWGY